MTTAVLRQSPHDALLVGLAAGYGAIVIVHPSAPIIAIGVWWIANTVSHNFIHLPFFRSRLANRLFSAYLSLLIGVPQALWRDRHLAHHAGRRWRARWTRQLGIESLLVASLWCALALAAPRSVFLAWAGGWCGAMLLCVLQGHYEHARGTVSHYGALYNLAFFNDGFHVEHHRHPAIHWSELPRAGPQAAASSRWPAVLRWVDVAPLDALERLVVRSGLLQRFVVRKHEHAFRTLLASLPAAHSITIVGGGLFPRTVLVLRRVRPTAALTVIDRSASNLRLAKAHLDAGVRVVHADYTPGACVGADLVIMPLAFDGDREAIYSRPPAAAVAVHDWIWRPRGETAVVSWLLLKRINLVRR